MGSNISHYLPATEYHRLSPIMPIPLQTLELDPRIGFLKNANELVKFENNL